MDLKRLGHLVALADECHFARAAERVHLSQPAFSRSIQTIESDLGMRLFDRESGQVKPTPAGAFLIERARRLLFDARCLPNPHWDPRLRPLSGRDAAVREHLEAQDSVREYVAQVAAFLDAWLPRFESETRSYLTVAFGCTGGRHRSVYLAERLAQHFRESGRQDVLTYHRELE